MATSQSTHNVRSLVVRAFLPLAIGFAPIVTAQVEVAETGQIANAGSNANDRFGQAVAVSGDLAVIGAPFRDGFFADMGAAYIYQNVAGTWTEVAYLEVAFGAGGAATDRFGAAVDTDGEWVAVGSPLNNTTFLDDGAVYVYRDPGTGWALSQKLTAPDADGADQFGASVEIDGDILAVSATADNTSRGSVYIYRFDGATWNFETKIEESASTSIGALFGTSLAIDGTRLLVGAPLQSGGGQVWVYDNAGTAWSNTALIDAVDDGPDDQFGWDVALAGDTALLSAHLQDDGIDQNTGAAYVYTFDGTSWTEQTKLTAGSSASADANFGYSLDVSANTAVIGAFQADTGVASLGGAAYVFRNSAGVWSQDLTLAASDATGGDLFAWAVDGTSTVIIGAPGDEPPGSSLDRVGSAYTFDLPPAGPVDTDADGLSDAEEIDLGTDPTNPDTDADGINDGDEVNLTLTDPLNADSDGDGLSDSDEIDTGTDPWNTDTDGDTLSDGTEVDVTFTDPLNADTDDDGLTDEIDPTPLDPGATEEWLEAYSRALASYIHSLEVTEFKGRWRIGQRARRNALACHVRIAAKFIRRGDYDRAMCFLDAALSRVDGDDRPRDWMDAGDTRDHIADEIILLMHLMLYG